MYMHRCAYTFTGRAVSTCIHRKVIHTLTLTGRFVHTYVHMEGHGHV